MPALDGDATSLSRHTTLLAAGTANEWMSLAPQPRGYYRTEEDTTAARASARDGWFALARVLAK